MKIIEQLRAKRAEVRKALDDLLAKPTEENRDLNEDESTQLAEHRSEIQALDARIAELEGIEAEERKAAEAALEYENRGPADGPPVRVRSEPLTYDRRNQRASYFGDVWQSQHGDPAASQRLARHAEEVRAYAEKADSDAADMIRSMGGDIERRDLNRTDGTGGYFVPPLWMVDEWVALDRAGRVTADLCNTRPLPAGTDSINIPKVATGTSTAAQTADNAAVSETDATDAVVNAPVRTIAGQQDVAIQLLEQSPIAFDEVIFTDLRGDYNSRVDAQVIAGTGASGQVKGMTAITSVDTTAYTDGSPTLVELWPKFGDSLNEIATNRFRPAEAWVMHPRRWYWASNALDSGNRPFIVPMPQGPYNALAAAGQPTAEGPAGHIHGVPVYLDANVPTTWSSGAPGAGTEDVIIGTRPSDHWLFESAIRTRILPDVGSGTLTVRLQLYAYVAFTAERHPRATSIIAGTGLAAPTF